MRPAVGAAAGHEIKRGRAMEPATFEEQVEEMQRVYDDLAVTKEYVIDQDLRSPLYYEESELQITLLKRYLAENKDQGVCIVGGETESDSTMREITKVLHENAIRRKEIHSMYLDIKKQWLYDNKLHCFDVELMSAIEKLFIHIFDDATFRKFLEFHDT